MGSFRHILEGEFPSDDEDSDYVPEAEVDEFSDQVDALETSLAAFSLGPRTDSEDHDEATEQSWVRRHLFFISSITFAFVGLACTYITPFFLHSLRTSELKFCDKFAPAIDCSPCPYLAKCVNGKARCPPDRVLMGTECVEHTNLEKLILQLHDKIFDLLLDRRGSHICGRDQSWRIHETQLFQRLSKLHNDEELFYEAFEMWKTRVIMGMFQTQIEYVAPFFQTASDKLFRKPRTCILLELFLQHFSSGFIFLTCALFVYFAYWYINKQQIESRQAQSLYMEIHNLLQDSGSPLALDVIRQSLSHRIYANVWKKCKDNINRDPSIQKSMRMVDGLQKRCWKVSS